MAKKRKLLIPVIAFIIGAAGGYFTCTGLHELERQQIAADEAIRQQQLYEAKVASLEQAMHGVTKYLNSIPTGRPMH